MAMTPAQLTTLEAAAKNDPEGLGFPSFVAINDWGNLASCFNWVRDGATPFPNNSITGPSGAITGATTATPILITSAAHGRATGDSLVISGVGGNTAANGTFTVTVLTANTFSLNGSAGNAAYTGGGTWNWCVAGIRQQFVDQAQIIGAIAPGDLITAGQSTAMTGAQQGAFTVFQALVNQPSGQIALTDQFGNDNNNAANLKKVVTNPSGSHTAILALETRTGSYAELLLGVSGVVVQASDAQAMIASGQA